MCLDFVHVRFTPHEGYIEKVAIIEIAEKLYESMDAKIWNILEGKIILWNQEKHVFNAFWVKHHLYGLVLRAFKIIYNSWNNANLNTIKTEWDNISSLVQTFPKRFPHFVGRNRKSHFRWKDFLLCCYLQVEKWE